MKNTRIADTASTPAPDADRDWWAVDLDDGERPGLVWVDRSAGADDAAVLTELERQRVVLHNAFTARVRALPGLQLRI